MRTLFNRAQLMYAYSFKSPSVDVFSFYPLLFLTFLDLFYMHFVIVSLFFCIAKFAYFDFSLGKCFYIQSPLKVCNALLLPTDTDNSLSLFRICCCLCFSLALNTINECQMQLLHLHVLRYTHTHTFAHVCIIILH